MTLTQGIYIWKINLKSNLKDWYYVLITLGVKDFNVKSPTTKLTI
jgi:hypothetical protein